MLACDPCNKQKGTIEPSAIIRAWHQLESRSLQAFIASQDEKKLLRRSITGRIKALLKPQSNRKKAVN